MPSGHRQVSESTTARKYDSFPTSVTVPTTCIAAMSRSQIRLEPGPVLAPPVITGGAKTGPGSSLIWILDIAAMQVVGTVTEVGNESYFLAVVPSET